MRRLCLTAAAVLLAGSTGSSTAAGAPPVLRLTASNTAETTLQLSRPTTLDLSGMRTKAHGRYAGLAVFAPSGALVAARVRVTAWTRPDGPVDVVVTRDRVPLPRGRYRVVVYADAPSTVEVPLRTGTSVVRTVARGTSARLVLRDLLGAAPAVGGSYVERVTYRGGFLVSQVYLRARAHQAEVLAQCFVPHGEADACVQQQGFIGTFASPGSVGDGWSTEMAGAYGHDLASGHDYDVVLQGLDADVPARAEWAVLSG
jgi:hypothetical protein